ncbi:putative adhesin RP828 precursor [Variibacter gotjawalensis]|uniref:Putative adhesin RP828 n=1 Tax=Variibacter gotjawalensis TaxID=1333996 RepID=A0A0S3Q0D9_9BRAD|nr:outer membrane beta-barrel protein [Variibacter gotjawalensis]NIK47488.1 opacity protein-like surface antigen [Variibacter gotjawalensis]RZS49383.1 opacity protein-like surface antigen [Variibacter gotjawalensis]BAT61647.1 putative adhesin RP828 precursor [Variibacter gotjawalensis]
MASLRVWAFAAAAAVTTISAAHAADLAPMGPPPMAPVAYDDGFAGGWYLRGDVGAGISRARSLDVLGPLPAGSDFAMVNSGFRMSDSYFIGGGIGYQFNSWLRFDATAEYRTGYSFRGVGFYTQGGGTFYDVYDGNMNSKVVLANAYFDLGTWYGVTAFVGGGIGMAGHTISHISDLGPFTPGGGASYGFMNTSKTDWQMAWALHAGLAYNVTNNFKVELAYRYLNMGSAESGLLNCSAAAAGACGGANAYRIRDIDSHDIKIGLRYHFNQPPMAYPAVVTKG